MSNPLDPEKLKIPAYLRNKAIVHQAKQKLILTALDRKEAGLSYKSKKPLAPTKTPARRRFKSYLSRLNKSQTTVSPKISRTIQSHPRQVIEDVEEIESSVPVITPESVFTSSQKLWAVGKVTNFIEKINVAIIMMSGVVKQNDLLLIEGENYIFLQPVTEMQIERQPVTKAKKGSHIGLKVSQPVKVNGKVYKITSNSNSASSQKSKQPSHQLSGQLSIEDAEADFDTPLI